MKMSLRWILVLIACGLRLLGLQISPPAFYIDEAMGAAHSLCYQQTGRDLFGHIGLFSKIDFGGFQSAPFLMSGAVWTAIFGPSAVSFRSWVAVLGILTVLAVYRIVLGATADKDKALWATLFAAFLPWAFQFSRISWDAPLATCLMAWGVAAVYYKPRKSNWPLILAGFLFALASYTYAPMRLNAGLLLLILPGVSFRQKFTALATFGLLNLPVLPYYADPEFISRSKLLALTSTYDGNPFRGAGIGGLFVAYLTQILRHLSPGFLLVHGDSNLRHSIQTFGMLDAVTFIGCVIACAIWINKFRAHREFFSRESLLFRLSLLGVFAGITPAALTWEGVPHAIRAMGAWPFFAILAAEGWALVAARWPKIRWAVVASSVLCFLLYLQSYFSVYPRIAAAWFDEAIYQHIESTHDIPSDYGAVARAYYRMSVKGERCSDIQKEFHP